MAFVGRRADGSVYGVWSSRQPQDADHPNIEEVPDDHQDVVVFLNRQSSHNEVIDAQIRARTAKTLNAQDGAAEAIVRGSGSFHFYAKPDSTSAQVVKLRHTSINNSDTITTENVGIVVKEIFA